jgi:tetrapyrrole methylase family protein/MazG family protein
MPDNKQAPPSPAAAFDRLAQIIARLRAPDGCPWDREQTHLTLRTHLLEETYETLDAIEIGDDAALCEELGDLLMQPVLHAQIAADERRFDIVAVLDVISDKLVRRHPHVFGNATVSGSGEVLTNWDAIKRAEKAGKQQGESAVDVPASVLDDIPAALPALSLALKVSKKAAKAGFEWPDVHAVMDKLREEVDELEVALTAQEKNPQHIADELGDLIFTAVNVARWQKIDPELALRDMVRRFTARFHAMEAAARLQGLDINDLNPRQWDELWNTAKAAER